MHMASNSTVWFGKSVLMLLCVLFGRCSIERFLNSKKIFCRHLNIVLWQALHRFLKLLVFSWIISFHSSPNNIINIKPFL